MESTKKDVCNRCGAVNSRIMVPSEGEEVCEVCGLIYSDRIIDETYEKRNFTSENGGKTNDNRISGPTRMGDSLGTNLVLANSARGGAERIRSGRALDKSNMTEKVFGIISSRLANVGVTKNVIEEAINFYKEISQTNTMKGRSLSCLIGALYYLACKKLNQDVSFEEVASKLKLDISRLKKAHNFITKHIGSVSSPEKMKTTLKRFIYKYADENPMTFDKSLAVRISENIVDSYILEGRNPKTLTGLSILIASEILKEKTKKNITVKDLSQLATKTTFDNVYKIIRGSLDKIVPPEYKSEIPRLIEFNIE